MKAVILSGGYGTRLRPLTYKTPKTLLPILNKPFVEYQLELLKKNGVSEVIFCVQYHSDQLKEYLGNGSKYGMKFYYTHEEEPLDTAGAAKLAQPHFNDQPILVCNGDVLTTINFIKMLKKHNDKKAMLTFAVKEVSDPSAFGVIKTNNNGFVTDFIEKPKNSTVKTINAGFYIIQPSLFQYIPKDKPYSFERQFFPEMLKLDHKMTTFLHEGYWLDIGKPAQYFQAHFDIIEKLSDQFNLTSEKTEPTIFIGEKYNTEPDCILENICFIGSNVTLGKKCYLDNVIIGNNCTIENNCNLRNVIIHNNVTIEKHSSIIDSIIGNNTTIESMTTIAHPTILAADSIIKKGTKS
ncbi:sugar phosphate nucleotidyltransferase [Candidatus Margulisiibacteriota bacterium]